MIYKFLGNTGLRVSVLSLGAWASYGVRSDACTQCMRTAFENGINFFDNAEGYGVNIGDAEKIMGDSLKELGWKRSDYVISTKFFFGGQGENDRGVSRKHLFDAVRASLGRLQLDYIDIVFAHRPDYGTPMEEIVRGFTHIINQGQALYWGTSEWTSQQITEAYWIARCYGLVPPSVEQPQYNIFERQKMEKEYLPIFKLPYGIGTTIWSPLNSGVLTGKYKNGIPDDSRLAHKNYAELLKPHLKNVPKAIELEEVAKKLGSPLSQLAIAWCLKNPNVSTVLLGATKVEQLLENLGSLEVLPKLTPEVMQEIEEIVGNKPKPEPTFGRELHP
jgi:voltage-dependent potassium channel beta subunit